MHFTVFTFLSLTFAQKKKGKAINEADKKQKNKEKKKTN